MRNVLLSCMKNIFKIPAYHVWVLLSIVMRCSKIIKIITVKLLRLLQ